MSLSLEKDQPYLSISPGSYDNISLLIVIQGRVYEKVPASVFNKIEQAKTDLLPAAKPIDDTQILSLDEQEKEAISRALRIKKGNIMQVAKALGISRSTLYSKIEKYGISLD